jgi:hypothetical protein
VTQSFCLIFSAILRVLCALCVEAEAWELIPIFQVEFVLKVFSLLDSGFCRPRTREPHAGLREIHALGEFT